jgi:hypothetical protein
LEDIRSLLSQYKERKSDSDGEAVLEVGSATPTHCEIPDVFIDEILPTTKLTRSEISLLMLLHRQVWGRPNLYRSHGIGPLNSYQELGRLLHLEQDELIHALRSLEHQGFIQTIRSGQYFVRKYFTEANDLRFAQRYEF